MSRNDNRRSDTRALTTRDPANNPETHGVMNLEYYQGASTYRSSLDRQGMNLSIQKGSLANPSTSTPGRYEKSIAEENDQKGDVQAAINGYPCPQEYGRPGRVGRIVDETPKIPSGQGLKGYGR
jgi:hypothetical protein